MPTTRGGFAHLVGPSSPEDHDGRGEADGIHEEPGEQGRGADNRGRPPAILQGLLADGPGSLPGTNASGQDPLEKGRDRPWLGAGEGDGPPPGSVVAAQGRRLPSAGIQR